MTRHAEFSGMEDRPSLKACQAAARDARLKAVQNNDPSATAEYARIAEMWDNLANQILKNGLDWNDPSTREP